MTPACAGTTHPDAFFSDDPADVELAKATCARCPVAAACFTGAVERDEQHGCWGGEVFSPLPADPMVVAEPARIRVTVQACPGSRARYVAGCRCLKCTEQNRLYKAKYDKDGPVTRREKVVDMNVSMFEGVSA